MTSVAAFNALVDAARDGRIPLTRLQVSYHRILKIKGRISEPHPDSTPPTVDVQLESSPPGADARTSLGPGCKTPCRVTITPPERPYGMEVTFISRERRPPTCDCGSLTDQDEGCPGVR